jgi:hypothetical protein
MITCFSISTDKVLTWFCKCTRIFSAIPKLSKLKCDHHCWFFVEPFGDAANAPFIGGIDVKTGTEGAMCLAL